MWRCVSLIENQDSAATFLDDLLHELESKADEAVFMGDNKLLDIAFECCVQNGAKVSSLEVKS